MHEHAVCGPALVLHKSSQFAVRVELSFMPIMMQATVNLATETALVRAAMCDEQDGHAERLEVVGKELAQVGPHTLLMQDA